MPEPNSPETSPLAIALYTYIASRYTQLEAMKCERRYIAIREALTPEEYKLFIEMRAEFDKTFEFVELAPIRTPKI